MAIRSQLPPCPDPAQYILVITKHGRFWRRKRGTVTPAVLNNALKRNAEALSAVSPASRRIIALLEPYTINMERGRILSRMNACLIPAYKAGGGVKMQALMGFDVQETHLFERLAQTDYSFHRNGAELWLDVRPREGCIKVKNRLVTGYFFEVVLLYGNAGKENGLKVLYERSGYYPVSSKPGGSKGPADLPPCRFAFKLPRPGTPYVLFLKVSCLEGNEMAAAGRHYGMKVVAAG